MFLARRNVRRPRPGPEGLEHAMTMRSALAAVSRVAGQVGIRRDNAVRRVAILAAVGLGAWKLAQGNPLLAAVYAALAVGLAVGIAHTAVALTSRR